VLLEAADLPAQRRLRLAGATEFGTLPAGLRIDSENAVLALAERGVQS
jgi:hypothetical protein